MLLLRYYTHLDYELSTGVSNVLVDVPKDLVVVESTLKTSEIQLLLESTGLLVFFKGFGNHTTSQRDDGTIPHPVPHLPS